MRKKVGIVTLGDYKNYGNRLQNYALYQVLTDKFNCDTRVILNFKNYSPIFDFKSKKNVLRYIFQNKRMYKTQVARTRKIMAFSKKWTREWTGENPSTNYRVEHENFDKIVLGSDQVWNFVWQTPQEAEYFMLKDVPLTKRIGYSISMGNPPILHGYESIFESEIHNFKTLSVREVATKQYLEKKFGVNSEVTLDPTLLLTKEEWINSLGLTSMKKPKYFLTYFLSKPSSKMSSLMKHLESRNIRAINLISLKKKDFTNYAVDPKEFLEFIYSAEAVLTDSFHASVFSIIFGTPFVVDNDREGGKMSARIDTLLNMYKLEDRTLTPEYSIERLLNVDFSNCEKNIDSFRKESFIFLDKALNGRKIEFK